MTFAVPVEFDVPQSAWRRRARAFLAARIEQHLGPSALVRVNQLMYFRRADPTRCLAPDVAFRRNMAGDPSTPWESWRWGAPHVAVELVSSEDPPPLDLDEQMTRYRNAGVAEVVRFDRDEPTVPIRLWDHISGDFVERDPVSPDARFCDELELYWCVQNHPEIGLVLGLAYDEAGESPAP